MSVSSLNASNCLYDNTANAPKKTKQNQQKKANNNGDKNPISRKGEAANLAGATFLGGLAVGGKLLLELATDGDFEVDQIAKTADKLVEKNKKNASKDMKTLYKIGAFAAIAGGLVAGFATLYTLFKAPQIAYDSKVNAYKKGKDMDVYIKSNKAEREIYSQIADKAKNASVEEKQELKEQYLKMRMAKNQVPDFAKQK